MTLRLYFVSLLMAGCFNSTSAQLNLSKRLEVEGGLSYTFATSGRGAFLEDDFTFRGGLGYQINLNAHLRQRFFGLGYRVSTYFGIGYGSGRGTFEDLSLSQEEFTSLLSSAPTVVRSQETTLQATYQFFSINFGFRGEVSERFALLLAPQLRLNRGGALNYESEITTTHLYDFTRQEYIQLNEPFVTNSSRRSQRSTHASLLLGVEYRTFNEQLYTKLLFDFGSPDSRFSFTTTGLQLLVGTRI